MLIVFVLVVTGLWHSLGIAFNGAVQEEIDTIQALAERLEKVDHVFHDAQFIDPKVI